MSAPRGYALQLSSCSMILPAHLAHHPRLGVRFTVTLVSAASGRPCGAPYRTVRVLEVRKSTGAPATLGQTLLTVQGEELLYLWSSLGDASALLVVEPTLLLREEHSGIPYREERVGWAPIAAFAEGVADDGGAPGALALGTLPGSDVQLCAGRWEGSTLGAVPGSPLQGSRLVYRLQQRPNLSALKGLLPSAAASASAPASAAATAAPPSCFLWGPLDAIPGLAPIPVPLSLLWCDGSTTSGTATQTTPTLLPCMCPFDAAAYATPQAPQLAGPGRLILTLASAACSLPPHYSERLMEVLMRSTEAQLGLPLGGLEASARAEQRPRLLSRALHLSLHNGITTVARAAPVPLFTDSSSSSSSSGAQRRLVAGPQAKPVDLPGLALHESVCLVVALFAEVSVWVAPGAGAPGGGSLASTGSRAGSGSRATVQLQLAEARYHPCSPAEAGSGRRTLQLGNKQGSSSSSTSGTLEIPLVACNPGTRLGEGAVWADVGGGGSQAYALSSFMPLPLVATPWNVGFEAQLSLRAEPAAGAAALGARVKVEAAAAAVAAAAEVKGVLASSSNTASNLASAASKGAETGSGKGENGAAAATAAAAAPAAVLAPPPSALSASLLSDESSDYSDSTGSLDSSADRTEEDRFPIPPPPATAPPRSLSVEETLKAAAAVVAAAKPPLPSTPSEPQWSLPPPASRPPSTNSSFSSAAALTTYQQPPPDAAALLDSLLDSVLQMRPTALPVALAPAPHAAAPGPLVLSAEQMEELARGGSRRQPKAAAYSASSSTSSSLNSSFASWGEGGMGVLATAAAAAAAPPPPPQPAARTPFSTSPFDTPTTHGHPLPPLDRARLCALGLPLYRPGEGAGVLLSELVAPQPDPALEASDTLAASTISLTFVALVPNDPPPLLVEEEGQGGVAVAAAAAAAATAAAAAAAAAADAPILPTTLRAPRPAAAAPPPPTPTSSAPRTIILGLQFYTAPYSRLGPIHVHPPTPTPGATASGTPLQQHLLSASAASSSSSSPSFPTFSLRIDPTVLGPGERAHFAAYLCSADLQVDVWDGESLLPLGTVSMSLAHLARGQAQAVVCAREYDIVSAAEEGWRGGVGGGGGLAASGVSVGVGGEGGAGSARPLSGAPGVDALTGQVVGCAGSVIGRLQVVLASAGSAGKGSGEGNAILAATSSTFSSAAQPAAALTSSLSASSSTSSRRALSSSMRAFASASALPTAAVPLRVVSIAQPLPASDKALASMLASQAGSSDSASASAATTLTATSPLNPSTLSATELGLLREVLALPGTPAAFSLPLLAALCETLQGASDPSLLPLLHASSLPSTTLAAISQPSRRGAASLLTLPPLPTRLARALQAFTVGTLGRTGGGVPGFAPPSPSPQACAGALTALFAAAEARAGEKGEALGRALGGGAAGAAAAAAGAAATHGSPLPCPEEARSRWGAGVLEDVGTVGEAEMALCGRLPAGSLMLGRVVQVLGKRLGLFSSAGREELGEWAMGCAAAAAAGGGGVPAAAAAAGVGGGGGHSMRTPCPWRCIVDSIVAALPAPSAEAAAEVAEAAAAAAAAAVACAPLSLPYPHTIADLRPSFLSLVHKLSSAFSHAAIEHEVHMGLPLSAHKALAAAAAAAGTGLAPGAGAVPSSSLPLHLPWPALTAAISSVLGLSTDLRGSNSSSSSSSEGLPSEEHSAGGAPSQQHLSLVAQYREGVRSSTVQGHLQAAGASSRVQLVAQRGRAAYFEYTVSNPLGVGAHFEVFLQPSSGELRVVTEAREWEWWRAVCSPAIADPGCSSGRAPFLPPAWQVGAGSSSSSSSSSSSAEAAAATSQPASATPRVFIPAGQSITLPLVYQCLAMQPPPATAAAAAAAAAAAPQPGIQLISPPPPLPSSGPAPPQPPPTPRLCQLQLVAVATQAVCASLHASVTLLPAPIARTIRYSSGEEAWVRGSLPLPPAPASAALYAVAGEAGGLQLALGAQRRAGGGGYLALPPDEGVVCAVVAAGAGEAAGERGGGARRELTFRTRARAAPSVTAFHVLLYDDPWRALLRAVWRVAIHSVHSCEGPSCTPGQSSSVELLLRGGAGAGSAGSSVRLFSNAARGSLSLLQGGSVALQAGAAVHRLPLQLCPLAPGPRRQTMMVHAVDGSGGGLLGAWRVGCHVTQPAVSRVYDVALVGGGSGSGSGGSSGGGSSSGGGGGRRALAQALTHKKLEYANEWEVQRSVTLLSSRPELVGVGAAPVALPPRGRGVIRMVVAAAPAGTQEDVHLYVRDESGAVEETLLLRLAWS